MFHLGLACPLLLYLSLHLLSGSAMLQHLPVVITSSCYLTILLLIIITKFINSAALNKIRRAAGTCHSALTKRCTFRRRAKVAVDRRSSAGKLFQVSGPETAKFLRPMTVAVRWTSSLPEAADRRCRRPERPPSRAQRDTEVLGHTDYLTVVLCLTASRRKF